MANRVFYYFYVPTWDYPPGGPIKLGNVLTSIKMPENPLFTAPLPSDEEVFSMDKRDVEYWAEKLRDGRFSIVTKFLSFLGIELDASVNLNKINEDGFTFERVVTEHFVPKEEYIQRCIEASPVRNYLAKSGYRKPVYVITGIKTVQGATAKTLVSRGYGGKLGVEVDGTVWSDGTVPVGGGPEAEGKTRHKRGISWKASDDFVLAFKVRKVRVNRKTGQPDKQEDYLKGAMLGNEAKKANDVPKICILAEEDPDPEAEGYKKDESMEGNDIIACAFPPTRDDEDDE